MIDPIHWTPEQKAADDSMKLSERTLFAVQSGTEQVTSNLQGLQSEIQSSLENALNAFDSLTKSVESSPKETVQKLEEIKSASIIANRLLKILAEKTDVTEKLSEISKILSVPDKETDITPIVVSQDKGFTEMVNALKSVEKAVIEKEYPEFPELPEAKETVKVDGEVKISKPSWWSPFDIAPIKKLLEKIADKEFPEFPDFSKSFSSIKELLSKIADRKSVELPMKEGRIMVEVDRISGGGGLTQQQSSALLRVATEETLAGTFSIAVDDTSTVGAMYVGKAAIGSSASSAVWQIKKIYDDSTPSQWADTNSNFDNSWTNRTSLTYA